MPRSSTPPQPSPSASTTPTARPRSREIAAHVAAAGGTVRTLSTVRRWTDAAAGPLVEIELEVEGLTQEQVTGHPRSDCRTFAAAA